MVECEESLIAGTTISEEGSSIPVEVEELSFGGCGGCDTVEAMGLPYSLAVEGTGGGDGIVAMFGGSGVSHPHLQLEGCGVEIPEVVGAWEIGFDFEGGQPAHLVAEGVELRLGEGNGPTGASLEFDAAYDVVGPESLFTAGGA